MSDPHEIVKSGGADNAAVDKALFATEDASAHIQWPPLIGNSTMHNAEDLDAAGVVRVHAGRDGGVALECGVESSETGFDLGTLIHLSPIQSLNLANTIIATVTVDE